ncbi:hypothetical protein PR001_g7422 [Phytophthora rubi]|uniref:Uncharacterized protein n=1 Tax=Phytophthora rubi TaxID=129364 RepID=A0A6A3N2J3_9STRA|nr:hypothetical protein PR002_g7632 [Phytophthora rubi]KAE9039658.1 hypothetical protein PR001_g7422 [Phytophthora rubi]
MHLFLPALVLPRTLRVRTNICICSQLFSCHVHYAFGRKFPYNNKAYINLYQHS